MKQTLLLFLSFSLPVMASVPAPGIVKSDGLNLQLAIPNTDYATWSGNGVCALGDSLMVLNSTDNAWGPTWFNAAILLSMGQLQFVHNGGVTGQTTTQILSRVYADAINYNCSTVFVDGGTNDFLGGNVVTVTEANLLQIYTTLISAGKRIVLFTIPPRTGQDTFNNTLNVWIRKQASVLNMPLVDEYSVLVNPATGLYPVGCSSDTVHPTGACVRTSAQQIVTDLSKIFLPHHPLLPAENTDPNNLITNSMMLLPGSGVPTGWTGTNTSTHVTYTTSTNTNILGNVLTATKAATSAGDNDNAYFVINSGLVPGHKYAFTGRFATANAEAGVLVYQIGAYCFTAGFVTEPLAVYPAYAIQGTDFPAGQWYMEFVLPAGVTIIQVDLNILTGTGSISIGQMGIYDLTALGS